MKKIMILILGATLTMPLAANAQKSNVRKAFEVVACWFISPAAAAIWWYDNM